MNKMLAKLYCQRPANRDAGAALAVETPLHFDAAAAVAEDLRDLGQAKALAGVAPGGQLGKRLQNSGAMASGNAWAVVDNDNRQGRLIH